ncbi:MAG: hypothetical protein ACKO01_05585 [Erythrobacter sp.]
MASNPSLDDEVKRARFCAYLNGKYHSDREAFYDWWDRVTNFCVLATGAVAFSDVFGGAAQKLGAAAIGLFALAQLVFSLSLKAREHLQFKRQYFDIASKLEAGEIEPAQAHAQMTRISGDEAPIFMALHAVCENWAYSAVFGNDGPPRCRIGWLARITRNFWRHSSRDFRFDPGSARRETFFQYFFGWGRGVT